MTTELVEGLSKTARIEVEESRAIGFIGDQGHLYATPKLMRDIENTCRDLLLEGISDDQSFVGTHIDVSDDAATQIGMCVDITATVRPMHGRAVRIHIGAIDPGETICRGSHSHLIIDVDKALVRVTEKLDSTKATWRQEQ